MYAWRLADATLLPLALLLGGAPAEAQLIAGIDGWADATIGLSTARWAGPRVPTPIATARPALPVRLDARDLPIRVHASARVSAARVRSVLAAAEEAHALLAAAGFLTSFGDAGQGGGGARDLYLVDAPARAVEAALDAAGNFAALDGGRAFALLDARLPSDRVATCVARALVEAELLELDPAEASSLRQSSAAYFAGLITGEPACDEASAGAADPRTSPLASPARGAEWLRRLGARQDGGRGTFLFDMWQFARQRTWEGRDLRASPDLMEAIAKALELGHDELPDVAAQIADACTPEGACAEPGHEVAWPALPLFGKPQAVAPLATARLYVRLEAPRPGARLRVWSRAAEGARFALAATRLDARDRPLGRIEAGSWHEPASQLSVELDAATHTVLISSTNVEDGIPDFDTPAAPSAVTLTVDVAP